jgi:hypothetical protein
MFGLMKPVIVTVLLATSLDAQTLADIARRERARRQGTVRATRVVTAEGIVTAPPAAEADAKPAVEGAKPAEGKPQTAGPPVAQPAPPAPPPQDPAVAAFNAQLQKLRQRFRELQDMETSLQLQVSQLTNQVFATQTDVDTQQQTQTRLGEAQQRLTGVRLELEQTRKALDTLQAQGPPRQ